jgi:hypothetical protein
LSSTVNVNVSPIDVNYTANGSLDIGLDNIQIKTPIDTKSTVALNSTLAITRIPPFASSGLKREWCA